MSTITDPRALKFTNQQIRPLSEAVRGLIAQINAAQTDWFSGLNALFPNDTTLVDDGRSSEGINELTGADVNSVVNILIAIQNASNAQIIAKPCVRPLSAS